jgi:hypothetical protein
MIRKAMILASVIGVSALSATFALAQLPLPLPLPLPISTEGTPEDRAACERDVQRYCKAAIPDNMRVLSCLQHNRQNISNACQMVLVKYGQ